MTGKIVSADDGVWKNYVMTYDETRDFIWLAMKEDVWGITRDVTLKRLSVDYDKYLFQCIYEEDPNCFRYTAYTLKVITDYRDELRNKAD